MEISFNGSSLSERENGLVERLLLVFGKINFEAMKMVL